uniref:FSA_C domain-containing protein n=1 Tax=Nippostrongylus brasiliensis TaxID=27835 RepID=A0A158R1N0_NIPBR
LWTLGFILSDTIYRYSNSSRLHLSLNGLQIHLYNQVQRYKEIAKLFRMEKLFGDDVDVKKPVPVDTAPPSAYWDRIWSLIGVIKLDIWSGRIVIGNRLLPYMLVVSMENLRSKIRLRESAADRALLSVEGQAESVRAAFTKHPEYDGKPYKEPPRTMGDGFAILQRYVTVDQQSTTTQRPIWESIWRFDHNTVFSYGPWAEQQRVLLYSFFYPPDYQTRTPDELPKRGQRRIHVMHDVRISLLKETSIDLWFMRGDQLESIHSRCQPGSTVDVSITILYYLSIWWITRPDGFSWSMHTSLLRLESTSSLPYRKLLEAETFSIDAEFHYPRVFNGKQTQDFKFRLTKCCCWLVWDHKRFISDLITEFLGDQPSDLISFVPYTVKFDFDVKDSFEIVLLLNESNWVDPSEKNPENVEAAIVGSHLQICFTLPFEDFLPELVSTTYTIRMVNELALRLRYPPGSATAPIIAALSRGALTNMYSIPSPHGRNSKNADEWHEVWRTESITCVIGYTYHPIVSKIPSDIPQHVLQEFLPKPVEHPKDVSSFPES